MSSDSLQALTPFLRSSPDKRDLANPDKSTL
jgi:hypothetical protein